MTDPKTREITPRAPREIDVVRDPWRILSSSHTSFSPLAPPHLGWTTFASQWQMRALALDHGRNWLWIATWGGILCWSPSSRQVIRHSSAQGLVGNPTRSIAVDQAGVVWAVAQSGALCSLSLDSGAGWQRYQLSAGWVAHHVIARPASGIFAVLCREDGATGLVELDSPDSSLCQPRIKLLEDVDGDVDAIIADPDGSIWLATAWGIYHYADARPPRFIDLSVDEDGHCGLRIRTRALAYGIDNTLWIGTNWGLYRLDSSQPTGKAVEGMIDEVLGLALDQLNAALWVATTNGVGRFVDGTWQNIPGSPAQPRMLGSGMLNGVSSIWATTAEGLCRLEESGLTLILGPSPEDALSNSIQCLYAGATSVWAGTARGLFRFTAEQWHEVCSSDEGDSGTWNVQALVAGGDPDELWVAAGQSGLRYIMQWFDVPLPAPAAHVIALAADEKGSIWIATPDALHRRSHGSPAWQPCPAPEPAIQTLCYQAPTAAAAGSAILWIGTATGLFNYRPDINQLAPVGGELEQRSIHALALDPRTNELWVGTDAGLFTGPDWQRSGDAAIYALAFNPGAKGGLWLGTEYGLEHIPTPDSRTVDDGPLRFTSANSGLALDAVTALSVRVVDNTCELWVGSPAGVSCYRYQ